MNENEINKMEVELKKYLDERKIENYAAKRKRIEEEKSSKEDYVKILYRNGILKSLMNYL